jgi:hypothetical protein
MIIQSNRIAPGARQCLIGLVRDREKVAAVNMDPPSAAAFALERVDALTAGEVSAHTNGRYLAPGCLVTIRNTSSAPAVFRAEVVGGPDVEQLVHEIEEKAEEAWTRGGDPISLEAATRIAR